MDFKSEWTELESLVGLAELSLERFGGLVIAEYLFSPILAPPLLLFLPSWSCWAAACCILFCLTTDGSSFSSPPPPSHPTSCLS